MPVCIDQREFGNKSLRGAVEEVVVGQRFTVEICDTGMVVCEALWGFRHPQLNTVLHLCVPTYLQRQGWAEPRQLSPTSAAVPELRQTSEMVQIIRHLFSGSPDEHGVTENVVCIHFAVSTSISATKMKNIPKSRARHRTAERSGTGIKPASTCKHRTNLTSHCLFIFDRFL